MSRCECPICQTNAQFAKLNAWLPILIYLFAKTFGKLDVPNAFNAIPNALIAKPNAQFANQNALIAKPNAQFAKPNASIAKSNAQFAKRNAWLPILIYLFPKTFGK